MAAGRAAGRAPGAPGSRPRARRPAARDPGPRAPRPDARRPVTATLPPRLDRRMRARVEEAIRHARAGARVQHVRFATRARREHDQRAAAEIEVADVPDFERLLL